MSDLIITPSSGKIDFIYQSGQEISRLESITIDPTEGLVFSGKISASSVTAPLNVTATSSNINYPFIFASSGETGAKSLLMDSAGGTYNPSTNLATVNITGTSSWATNAVTNANLTGDVTSVGNATTIANSVVTNAKLANSSVTIGSTAISLGADGAQTTIVGLVSVTSTTFVGALTGTATTASYANALNAANQYTVGGITGSHFGTSSWATNATNALQLDGTAAASYVTLAGVQNLTDKTITGTFTGNLTGTATTASYANALNAANSYTVAGLTVNGNFAVNGSLTVFSASNVYITSSNLVVTDNIITMNALSPYQRYAGIQMYDTGSGTLSNFLWDGDGDYFFLSGSSVNGKIITGPDSQANLSANFVPKATAGYKLGNSIIYDDGTNIGIGITTPVYKTEIYSGVKTSAFTGLSISNFNNYDGTDNSLVKSQLRFAILENPISTYDASQRTFAILESGNEANNSSSDGFFAISTRLNGAVAEKFRITSTGNVGIGTTNPAAKLYINASGSSINLLRGVTYNDSNASFNNASLEYYDTSTSNASTVTKINYNAYFNKRGTANITGYTVGNFNGSTQIDSGSVNLIWDYSSRIEIRNQATASSLVHFVADSGYVTAQGGVLGKATDRIGFFVRSQNQSALTLTNQYGIYIEDLGQSTNNYAFYSNVSAASNKYNIYAAGTANNYFAGYVGIGATSFVYGAVNRGLLEVYGSSDALIALRNDTANFYIHKSGNNFAMVNGGAGYMTFNTNGSDRLYIDSNGYIGIATTSILTTGGNAQLSISTNTTAVALSFGASNNDMSYIRRLSAGVYQWQTYNSGNTGQIHLQPYGGSVGIGTTSPSSTLHVNSTTAGATLLRTDGTNGTLFSVVDDLSDSLMSVNNSAGLPVLEVFADDRIVMGQYGQNDFVLVNNKVGIGTNNPANKLYVSGSVSIGSGTYNTSAPTNGLIVEGKVGVGTNSVDSWAQLKVIGTSALGGIVYVTDKIQALSAFPGSATNLQLNTDGGNVGIGTTLPFAKLHVQGNISGSSFTSSISNAVGFLGTSSWATNAVTALNGGVTSVSGTDNQVIVSGNTGAVTFSLPQSIHTTATPAFTSVSATTFTGALTGTATTASYANALNAANNYTVTGITGALTGNVTGTATTASYANALNAANSYTVAGITGALTGNVTGTATTASYANSLNAANKYTVVGITGSLFGTSSWATNATNALQLGGTAAASYVTLTGAQNLSEKTITGTFTGNLTGTATTASYANALNAANQYTVGGITGSHFGTSSWASNAVTSLACTGNAGTVTNGVYTTGNQSIAGTKTFTGVTSFSNTSDYQIVLDGSGGTWAGINWSDVNGADVMWFNGQNETFAIGGGGSNVSGKKLHVHGGVTIGADYHATVVPSNGLSIQGGVQIGNYSTYVINALGASGTQSRTFEIARLGIDYNDWNNIGTFEVEIHEKYYSQGLKKVYNIWYGYPSNSGIRLVELRGTGDNNFQCRIGSQVQISGDSYYLPVYVDIKYYSSVDVVIKTNRNITTTTNPEIGYTYINIVPTPTNISSFTADSDLEISTLASAKLGGNTILTTATTSATGLSIGGTAATASYANALNAANSYTVTGITGNLTGNVTGTATTASYANALNAANRYTVVGITGSLFGTSSWATNATTATTATTANALNTGNSYTGVNFTATGFFQTNGGSIKTDTASGLAVLTTADGAQSIRTKGILLGTSYDTNPGANEIRTTNNTSLYLNARGTGDIQFQTADNLKMMLLNNGNVGIGTTSPTAKLVVMGEDIYNYAKSSVPTAIVADSVPEFLIGSTDNIDGEEITLRMGSVLSSYYTHGAYVKAIQGAGVDYYKLAFGTSNGAAATTKMTIANDGNVGIGTTDPAAKLEISSSTAASLLNIKGAGGNGILFVSGSGNVGIGTTVPVAKLHLSSTTAGATLLRTDGTNGTLFSVVDDLSDSLMSVNNSAGLPVLEVFADDRIVAGQYGQNDFVVVNNKVGIGTNNPLAKLHVSSSASIPSAIFMGGNVGIGTTSPVAKLSVYTTSPHASATGISVAAGAGGANLLARDSDNYHNWFPYTDGLNYYSANGHVFRSSNHLTNYVTINSSGNVGIGLTLPTAPLHVVGVISGSSFTGAGTGLTGTATSLTAGTSTTANSLNTANNYQVKNLTVSSNIALGNRNSIYSLWHGGNQDLAWKKIADITLPNTLYAAASFKIEVLDAEGNFGWSVNCRPMTYFVACRRSGGTLNSYDDATVSGPINDYVRAFKTSQGVYELQIRQIQDWQIIIFTCELITSNGNITYATGVPSNGSTTGTAYTVVTNGYTQYLPNVSAITSSASLFSGAGTGLTGTAANLSVGGSAATATSASFATTAATAANGGVTSIAAGTSITVSTTTGAVTVNNAAPNATHTGEVTGATGLTIADSAVITARLADAAVTTIKIADANVTTAKLANNAVTDVKITNGAITNPKLANSAVTVGTTSISLGAAETTIGGLVSVTSNLFVGPLTGNVTGTADTANALTTNNSYTVGNLTVNTMTQLTGVKETYVGVTPASTVVTIDLNAGTVFRLTYNSVINSFTISNLTAAKVNSFTLISIPAAGAGGINFTFNPGPFSLVWAGNVIPTATTTVGKFDVFSFIYDGTRWYGFVGGLNY